MARWMLSLVGIASVAVSAQTPRVSSSLLPAPSASEVRAVSDRYCVTCHSNHLKTAGLSLEGLDVTHAGDAAEAWEKVVRKLRAGAMPPAGVPRPDESTMNRVASAIEPELDRVAEIHPNPGRADSFHRLNRNEYRNAIRDLLALDVDVSSLLPGDE